MKIFENKKRDNIRTIKLFGKILYKLEIDAYSRKQTILNGLIKTFKSIDKENFHQEKITKILNIEFSKKIKDRYYEKKYIGKLKIFHKNYEDVFYKKFKQIFQKNCDDIYILSANCGETYLFLRYCAAAYIKKNNSKNPLFIATKKYHTNLLNMLCPDITHLYIPDKKLLSIEGSTFRIKKQRFFKIFPPEHFKCVENEIKINKDAHYFEMLLKTLDMAKENISSKEIILHDAAQKSMIEKVAKTDLNFNNFVLLAPEAFSCKEIEKTFWENLCCELQKLGFDVFMNIAYKETKFKNCKYKSCPLSLEEIYALAKKAKSIITLRSGLSEILMQCRVPCHCIYTDFKKREDYDPVPVEKIISGFGIKKLPDTEGLKIYEYNAQREPLDALVQKILDTIKGNN